MKNNSLLALLLLTSLVGRTQYFTSVKPTTSNKAFQKLEALQLHQIRSALDSLGLHSLPPDGQLIMHDVWTGVYSGKHKQPYWVSYLLSKDILFGSYSPGDQFRADTLLKKGSADSSDYLGSGYDRGHLAPPGDFRWSKKALAETYLYSNIAPQHPKLNKETWYKLETLVREWAIDAGELFIVTGPVLNQHFTNLQKGSYSVSIPHYYYKIVADLYPPEYKAIGFLIPNKNVPFHLTRYIASIDSLERLTGIDFFPKLDDSLEVVLENQADLFDWEPGYQDEVDSISLRNYGKNKLNTSQAGSSIGKYATVCGNVVGVKYIDNGKANPTYINLDKKFPDQQFTVVIYGDARKTLPYVPEEYLSGKTICVKGKIGQYKDVPQIVVNDASQIEILY